MFSEALNLSVVANWLKKEHSRRAHFCPLLFIKVLDIFPRETDDPSAGSRLWIHHPVFIEESFLIYQMKKMWSLMEERLTEVRCFVVKPNNLDYCALRELWRLMPFPRKTGLFVLTYSFQKQMDRRGSTNLEQECSDVSHAVNSFVSPGNSAHAFIYPISGRSKKALITFQFIWCLSAGWSGAGHAFFSA